jgi:hypothetical protein
VLTIVVTPMAAAPTRSSTTVTVMSDNVRTPR